ncbi:MAG TPA: hypothetical protein VK004_01850, partial [Ignavibacteria bacterium]|nr:hypothetical protein [Ignavibacteria bacterium]
DILRTFEGDEFKKLGKFLDSPYFKHPRDLVPIYNALKPYYPEFSDPSLTKQSLFNRLYPGKNFGDTKSESLMKTLLSDLFKASREFLVYLGLERDKNRRKYYMLDQLRERKLYKQFEKEFTDTDTSIEDAGSLDLNALIDYFNAENLGIAYHIEMGNASEVFKSMLSGTDFIMLLAMIKAYRNTDIKHLTSAFNTPYKDNLADKVLAKLDSEKLLADLAESGSDLYPYIAVNYYIHLMNKYPDEFEYYYKAKNLLFKHVMQFSRTEKYVLFSILASYCSRKSGREHVERFSAEEFELNKMTLELGIYRYSEKDDFQINNFRNMVLTALDVHEIDWLEKFIEKYSRELNPKYRKNMKEYSLAQLYFARGEYERSLEEIAKIKYNYLFFQLDLKYLTFKNYYEMNYLEEADSVLNAISRYISTTKDISESFRNRGTSFVKFARELLRRKSEKNSTDIDLLLKKIMNDEEVNSRQWLVEKVDEIIIN